MPEEVPAWARDRVKADKGATSEVLALAMELACLYMLGVVRQTGKDASVGAESRFWSGLSHGIRRFSRGVWDDVDDPAITIKTGLATDIDSPATGGSRAFIDLQRRRAAPASKLKCGQLSSKMGLERVQTSAEGISHSAGKMSWKEALAQLNEPIESVATRGRDSKGMGFTSLLDLDGTGLYMGMGPSTMAMISEVEVDTRLGKTRVLRTWSAVAAGRILARGGAWLWWRRWVLDMPSMKIARSMRQLDTSSP